MVITIRDLKLPINYLEQSDEVKQSLCREVIEKSFQQMSVKATKEQKIDVMKGVLISSIHYNESIEAYELCAVFKDILIELEKQT